MEKLNCYTLSMENSGVITAGFFLEPSETQSKRSDRSTSLTHPEPGRQTMSDTTSSPRNARAGDDVDELLRAYFRTQVPAVWPPPPSVEPCAEPSSSGIARFTTGRLRSDSLQRSRYVPAASAITLLALGWFLIEQNFTPYSTPPSPSNVRWPAPMLPQSEASNPAVLQHLRKSLPPISTPSTHQPADHLPDQRPIIKIP